MTLSYLLPGVRAGRLVGVALGLAGVGLGTAVIEFIQGFLPPAMVPGGYAESADPLLRGLHALSDFTIGATYVAISATLLYFVYRARHWMPFQGVFVAFGAFIVFCGGTHFMHVALLYAPAYSLAGVIQSLTVLASLAT